jgi:hypothetical protein
MTDTAIPEPLPIGYRLHDRYVIEAELSPQRMGRAYRAFDTGQRETVALNVLSSEATAGDGLTRFRRLFKRAFYTHRGDVFEYGEDGGVVYAVVKFIDGVGPAVDVGDE